MTISTRILIGLLLASNAGCSLVGEYQRPDSSLPSQWKQSGAGVGVPLASQVSWRAFFSDARLQSLIEQAIEHNHDLLIALARVAETRAQLGVARADRLPSISLLGSSAKSQIPSAFTGTDKPVTTERSDLSLSVVSYEIDFWGRVANLSESAQASYLASEAASRSLRITVISVVANIYFSLLEMEARIEISRAVLETRKQSAELMRQGMVLGAAARSDYLLAESLLSSAHADLAVLENQRDGAEHMLALLVGNPKMELPAGGKLRELDVQHNLAAGIPSEVLYARPDVVASENRLKEAHANIGAARAAFLPRILLTAGLGLSSRNLAGLFGVGAGNWNFQPSLSMPLFDSGRSASYMDIAEARKISAIADYERTIQQAFREVADLLSARASLADQERATKAAGRAHQERLIVAEARFKAGTISYLEVLDAQREVLAAQLASVLIHSAQLTNSAQLYKALGGGDTDARAGL